MLCPGVEAFWWRRAAGRRRLIWAAPCSEKFSRGRFEDLERVSRFSEGFECCSCGLDLLVERLK